MSGEGDVAERTYSEKVLAMNRNTFSLKDMLTQPEEANPEVEKPPKPANEPSSTLEAVPSLEELSPLPGAGEPYRAHARASNKPIATFHLMLGDASVRGFSYANLDTVDLLPSSEPGQGPVIVARFSSLSPTEVKIEGRNLDALYVLIGSHRVGWLKERQPSREFLPAEETVITLITIGSMDN